MDNLKQQFIYHQCKCINWRDDPNNRNHLFSINSRGAIVKIFSHCYIYGLNHCPMYKYFCHLVALLILPICLFANDYDKAWEALHENNRKQALEYLEKAMNDPALVVDAYLTYIYLKTFEGNDQSVKDFDEKILNKVKDPNPYLFALWFNEAALGGYGKKTEKRQLELIKEILADNRFNGSLRSAAHYFNGLSLLDSKEFEKAKKEWGQMGSVTQWQLVGPFENLSRSGFDKSYGPLEHPEKDAAFKSLTNALVKWFSPPHTNNDGWFFIQPHLPNRTAVTYAQSFIDIPADMDVLINAGVNGSIKVWVNDALVISEERERVTELDCYKSACHLKKGYNRVLVQVGYTNNSIPNFIIRLTDNKLRIQYQTWLLLLRRRPYQKSDFQLTPRQNHCLILPNLFLKKK